MICPISVFLMYRSSSMKTHISLPWVVLLLVGTVTGLSSHHNAKAIDSPPTLILSSGSVVGLATNVLDLNTTVNKFLGIPFAAPPVDALRFRIPKPALPWGSTSVLNATSYANACLQANEDSSLLVDQSEACLYLNVFAPSQPGAIISTQRFPTTMPLQTMNTQLLMGTERITVLRYP